MSAQGEGARKLAARAGRCRRARCSLCRSELAPRAPQKRADPLRVALRAALRAVQGIAICKPGVPFSHIGDVITQHAHAEGLSVVKSFCGHGIGELFHCAPNIPHYANNKARGTMKAGQCFTIEPMLNAGKWKDVLWPDGWTAVTTDGKRSAQFEHTLLLTEQGAEVLTRRQEDSPRLCFQ